MTDQRQAGTSHAPTFGYHPAKDALEAPLQRGSFRRALVLDAPVRALVDHVQETRVLWNADLQLPEGLYWFQGLDHGDLILQVGSGAFPGGSTVVPLDHLSEDHPLAAAWNWSEDLWETATVVPRPRFAVNDPAITHPGMTDVVVRDRAFTQGTWSYTVIVEGARQEIFEGSSQLRV